MARRRVRRTESGLDVDLVGRLRNFALPPYRVLVPVFEAVVNSIHAIQEAKPPAGRISIEVQRLAATASGLQQELPLYEQTTRPPITGFRIRDNGCGFTSDNYTSFRTSDSRRKVALGGRGVGRFTWLKVFDHVAVQSTYAYDAQRRHRSFRFSAEGGVTDQEDTPCAAVRPVETVVALDGVQDAYVAHLPKKTTTLAQHIVDHCFGAIRGSIVPLRVELVDGDADPIDISQEVQTMFANALVNKIEIEGRPFTVTHIRVSSPEVSQHKLILMGGGREVRVENLAKSIPQLSGKLDDETRPFWWWSLVESPALDEAVTPERDDFTLPREDVLPGVLSIPAIRRVVVPVIADRLATFIEPIKERTRAQVRRYVETAAPQYRYVLTMRPEAIDRLPPDLSEEDLDAELHHLGYEIEADLRAEGAKILGGGDVDPNEYDRFVSEENAVGKANLAKYVVHRRRVLDLFRKALERKDDGKYPLEEAIHKLIFPLRRTSDEVPYEQLNLWMIDERLAYHYYLASDKELRGMDVLDNNSRDRPDLIIFNAPFAFTDDEGPFNSIVIVEFKRPARDDYTDDENPVKQVYDYIRRVREAKAYDRSGRLLAVPDHIPFYCFIVCDVTPKLGQAAEDAALTKTPDGLGFFGYNSNLRAYVEVVSFTKLLTDAQKRNRVFFEKLGLPKS
jgi:hypothetical protein